MRGALGYLLDRDSPMRIRPAYFLSILPWLVRFAWASRRSAYDRGVTALAALQQTACADLQELLHDAQATHLLKMHGHLVLVEKPESTAAARMDIARMHKFDINADWISPMQVSEIAPAITAKVAGALKFTGTGHVDDPYAVCEALRDAFIDAGGTLVQADVVAVENTSAGFRAKTASGTPYVARQLVLSCGAWSKSLATQLGYPVPLDTERGYHITLPGGFPRLDIPVASLERKVIMTPMSGGLRMTGTVEFGGLQLPPDPGRFEVLAAHMRALAANVPTGNMTTWMGFRPSLPDHLPVLGRVPDGRRLFFAFGHQHLGLTLAGVTARVIAAQAMGSEPGINLAPFAPDRF
jgi:D-amino-acid dehydrogenase